MKLNKIQKDRGGKQECFSHRNKKRTRKSHEAYRGCLKTKEIFHMSLQKDP